MTMILIKQSVLCILYIHQPIFKKKIHINSLDTNNILVPDAIKKLDLCLHSNISSN